MRDLLILAIHLVVMFAKLLRPGGVRAGAPSPAAAVLEHYAWQQHCRGLFQIPIAA